MASLMNRFEPLTDGRSFGEAILKDMRAAKESIDIQMMCFEADSAGSPIAEILIDKAGQGLRCRLIVDGYMELEVNDRPIHIITFPLSAYVDAREEYHRNKMLFARLEREGVGFKMVNPPGLMMHRALWRNHKKLIVIDGRIAYMGGINITEHNFRWHDYMFRMQGTIVQDLSKDFEATWTGKKISFKAKGDHLSEDFEDILNLIDTAKERIIIQSPYVGGKRIIMSLLHAQKRGVDVTVIMPHRNNKWIYQMITEYHKALFHRKHIRFLLFPRFMHSKLLLVDDRVVIGSCNFNSHIAPFLNEISLVSADKRLHKQIEHILKNDMGEAKEYRYDRNILHSLFYHALNSMADVVFWALQVIR